MVGVVGEEPAVPGPLLLGIVGREQAIERKRHAPVEEGRHADIAQQADGVQVAAADRREALQMLDRHVAEDFRLRDMQRHVDRQDVAREREDSGARCRPHAGTSRRPAARCAPASIEPARNPDRRATTRTGVATGWRSGGALGAQNRRDSGRSLQVGEVERPELPEHADRLDMVADVGRRDGRVAVVENPDLEPLARRRRRGIERRCEQGGMTVVAAELVGRRLRRRAVATQARRAGRDRRLALPRLGGVEKPLHRFVEAERRTEASHPQKLPVPEARADLGQEACAGPRQVAGPRLAGCNERLERVGKLIPRQALGAAAGEALRGEAPEPPPRREEADRQLADLARRGGIPQRVGEGTPGLASAPVRLDQPQHVGDEVAGRAKVGNEAPDAIRLAARGVRLRAGDQKLLPADAREILAVEAVAFEPRPPLRCLAFGAGGKAAKGTPLRSVPLPELRGPTRQVVMHRRTDPRNARRRSRGIASFRPGERRRASAR